MSWVCDDTHCDFSCADRCAVVHDWDNSSERIRRNPVGPFPATTATPGTAPHNGGGCPARSALTATAQLYRTKVRHTKAGSKAGLTRELQPYNCAGLEWRRERCPRRRHSR